MVGAADTVRLSRHAKELKPFGIVLSAADRFRATITAFVPSIDDVDGRAKCCSEICCLVSSVRNEEAGHDIVHRWLGVLRCHVEPDTCSHSEETIFSDLFRVFKKIHLTVVRAGRENIRELSIIIIPGKLERSATIVLLSGGGRPGCERPATRSVSTRWVVGAIAANLLHPVEGLCPKLAGRWIALTSLLAPVGKNCGKLSAAHLVDIVLGKVGLIAEAGELGNGFEEVVVGVDSVSLGEAPVPVAFVHDGLNALHICSRQVIRFDGAINTEGSSEAVLNKLIF